MKKMISKVFSLLMAFTLVFMYLPGTVSHAEGEEPLTPFELSGPLSTVTENVSDSSFEVSDGKAVLFDGRNGKITLKNVIFNLTGAVNAVNSEYQAKIAFMGEVEIDGFTIVADQAAATTAGTTAIVSFLDSANVSFANGVINGTDCKDQFMASYGTASSSFDNVNITVSGETDGWVYVSYPKATDQVTMSFVNSTFIANNGNIRVYAQNQNGANNSGTTTTNITNSQFDFNDNIGGGFVFGYGGNYVNITNSTVNVNNNGGNASNGGVWALNNSTLNICGNRSGHGLSCSKVDAVDSTVNILHNGYAGLYIKQNSSFEKCEVNIRCNGENLLSYSAGDVWLNGHTLTVTDCGTAWLGAVGRTGSVVTEGNTKVVAADLNDLGVDKTTGLIKSQTSEIIGEDAAQLEMENHDLFINSNVVSKDDPEKISPYPRGNAEELGTSNDVDLWADPDVDINTVIASGTPYIASFTENQLAHHSYDWDNGVIYQDEEGKVYTATSDSYGVLRYECVDVCADYKNNTEEHPYSRNCPGTYVYAPLVGITYNANTDDEVTGMPVTEDTIEYGGTATDQDTVPDREHYKFTGWYYDAECTKPFDYTDELKDNWTEVYAGWTAKENYTVTVNYIDLDSGKTISDSYVTNGEEGSTYDVTEFDQIPIDSYKYVKTEGDALSGVLEGNVVIHVYYSVIRPETPITPDQPTTPESPDTGDSTNIAGYACMALIAAGIALLMVFEKRRRA